MPASWGSNLPFLFCAFDCLILNVHFHSLTVFLFYWAGMILLIINCLIHFLNPKQSRYYKIEISYKCWTILCFWVWNTYSLNSSWKCFDQLIFKKLATVEFLGSFGIMLLSYWIFFFYFWESKFWGGGILCSQLMGFKNQCL